MASQRQTAAKITNRGIYAKRAAKANDWHDLPAVKLRPSSRTNPRHCSGLFFVAAKLADLINSPHPFPPLMRQSRAERRESSSTVFGYSSMAGQIKFKADIEWDVNYPNWIIGAALALLSTNDDRTPAISLTKPGRCCQESLIRRRCQSSDVPTLRTATTSFNHGFHRLSRIQTLAPQRRSAPICP